MPDFRMNKNRPIGSRNQTTIANYNVGGKSKPKGLPKSREDEANSVADTDDLPDILSPAEFEIVGPAFYPQKPTKDELLSKVVKPIVEKTDEPDNTVAEAE